MLEPFFLRRKNQFWTCCRPSFFLQCQQVVDHSLRMKSKISKINKSENLRLVTDYLRHWLSRSTLLFQKKKLFKIEIYFSYRRRRLSSMTSNRRRISKSDYHRTPALFTSKSPLPSLPRLLILIVPSTAEMHYIFFFVYVIVKEITRELVCEL